MSVRKKQAQAGEKDEPQPDRLGRKALGKGHLTAAPSDPPSFSDDNSVRLAELRAKLEYAVKALEDVRGETRALTAQAAALRTDVSVLQERGKHTPTKEEVATVKNQMLLWLGGAVLLLVSVGAALPAIWNWLGLNGEIINRTGRQVPAAQSAASPQPSPRQAGAPASSSAAGSP